MDLTIVFAVMVGALIVLGWIAAVYAATFVLWFCLLELLGMYELTWPSAPGITSRIDRHVDHRVNASIALVAPAMVVWWLVLMTVGVLLLAVRAYAAPTTYMVQATRGQMPVIPPGADITKRPSRE